MVFALRQFTSGNHMFFFHYWRRREPGVSLRCGDSRCSFLNFNVKMSTVGKFASVKQRVWRSMCKSIHFWIYIRKPHVFFHYWRRREPPVLLSIADFRSAFIVYGHFLFFILVLPKICNGKTKGLANLMQINTLLNVHKEMHMFFSHYWRRREPPVSLRCPRFRSGFTTKVKI